VSDADPPADAEPEDVRALARRMPAGAAARTMTVDLRPEDVIERLVRLEGMEERSPDHETRFEPLDPSGRCFYARTSDGLVLWRRPERDRQRGVLDPVPYPDMVEVRIAGVARGSRLELRWRPHPSSRAARRRLNIGFFAMALVVALVPIMGATQLAALLIPSLWALAVVTRRYWRAAHTRRALQPLLVRAHAALAPHELGRADLEGSAFRVLPERAEAAASQPERRGK
jgi:hypothetical protein